MEISTERDVDEVYRDVYPVFKVLTRCRKYYHNIVFVLGILSDLVVSCVHTHRHTHTRAHMQSVGLCERLLCTFPLKEQCTGSTCRK